MVLKYEALWDKTCKIYAKLYNKSYKILLRVIKKDIWRNTSFLWIGKFNTECQFFAN